MCSGSASSGSWCAATVSNAASPFGLLDARHSVREAPSDRCAACNAAAPKPGSKVSNGWFSAPFGATPSKAAAPCVTRRVRPSQSSVMIGVEVRMESSNSSRRAMSRAIVCAASSAALSRKHASATAQATTMNSAALARVSAMLSRRTTSSHPMMARTMASPTEDRRPNSAVVMIAGITGR